MIFEASLWTRATGMKLLVRMGVGQHQNMVAMISILFKSLQVVLLDKNPNWFGSRHEILSCRNLSSFWLAWESCSSDHPQIFAHTFQ